MKSAALFVFFCVCANAQPGTVEGLAVHAVTGQPMSGVHVRLFTGGFDTVSAAYGAITDSAGRFSMAQVAAGSYILTAERTGFVYVRKTPVAGPATNLIVKSGERPADLKLELSPRAIIAGRVVDEFGDPVANVPVMLEAVSKASPMGIGMVGGAITTDDRGEFRLRAGPGKYRVRATPREMYMASEWEASAGGASKAVFGPTYFPNTANKDQASVVEAGAGAEINGVEIRLTRRSGFTISGTISGMPDRSMATVMLQSGESARRFNRSMGRGVPRDGKFSFPMMEPGYYRIFAFYPSGKPPLQSQAVEFKLENGDVTNLQLTVAPGGEITGTLEFAGGDVPAGNRTVRLTADMQFGRVPSGQTDKDGAFHIANVLPDKYRVLVDPLPENAYIKTVQLDGGAVPDGLMDFSGGAHDAKVKITVGRNGGQITGAVVEKDGQRINSHVATVYLLQDPENVRQEQSARVTPEGKYSFKAIRPGKYRLFAIDPLRDGAGRSPDGLKELFTKAEEIEIKEGDRITKDAKVMVSEASHATQ